MTFTTHAHTSFSKSTAYDTHRPSYPLDAVQQLLEHLRVANVPGVRILDVGAGTGKLTEQLATRPEEYDIIAVEPHPDMRRVLAEKNLPRVQVRDGLADALPLTEEEVKEGWDAVVVAQV